MRRLTRAFVVAALAGGGAAATACAGGTGTAPPGGPEDRMPPRVVRITPESAAVSQRARAVRFEFNETVSDRPGRGELNQYFLISPSDGEPRVNWHRGYIDVRPRHGFRANTAYVVTLLPGIADLRGNVMRSSVATVFSTGATIPGFGIFGRVYDWAAERPAPNAIVEAISRPDSVVYLAVSDSLGAYVIGPFGPGRYTLRTYLDRNNNRALDPGEAWDSATVLISGTRPVKDLLAITRDTIPPHIATIAQADSVTLRITFDRPLDRSAPLTAAQFRIQRTDSTVLAIASVTGARAAERAKQQADSAHPRPATPVDSAHPAPPTSVDSARSAAAPPNAAPPAVPSSIVPLPGAASPRPAAAAAAAPAASGKPPLIGPPPIPRPPVPAPETAILVTLAPPQLLVPGTILRVTAIDARSIMGRVATSTRTFTVPRPAPPAKRDSTATRDSTAKRDSLRRAAPARPPR